MEGGVGVHRGTAWEATVGLPGPGTTGCNAWRMRARMSACRYTGAHSLRFRAVNGLCYCCLRVSLGDDKKRPAYESRAQHRSLQQDSYTHRRAANARDARAR